MWFAQDRDLGVGRYAVKLVMSEGGGQAGHGEGTEALRIDLRQGPFRVS